MEGVIFILLIIPFLFFVGASFVNYLRWHIHQKDDNVGYIEGLIVYRNQLMQEINPNYAIAKN